MSETVELIVADCTTLGLTEIEIIELGTQGPPGSSADGIWRDYTHNQMIPSASWLVTHSLNRQHCQVTVMDSAQNVVVGDIEYLSPNSLSITFSAAFSGLAYCS